jgi:hypothetical protein
MAAFITTPNGKPAEALIPGGLVRVLLTALSTPPGKDEDHGLVHDEAARV